MKLGGPGVNPSALTLDRSLATTSRSGLGRTEQVLTTNLVS
jgi:hypothetical protein